VPGTAQDLHDDLGATLTEIRFLNAVESRDSSVPADTRSQLSEVSEKSRQMVSSLDEIVWAVNPANYSWVLLCQKMHRPISNCHPVVTRNEDIRLRSNLLISHNKWNTLPHGLSPYLIACPVA